MRAISIVNMKGGVGKTITAVNLAAILAVDHGKRVLLVDCDGQGNATSMFLPRGMAYPELYNLLSRGNCATCETEIEKLCIIPTDNSVWRLDSPTMTALDIEDVHMMLGRLVHDMAGLDLYDIIIFDCPPSFSPACISAIVATDTVIIPVLCDAFSAQGTEELVEQIDGMRAFNPGVRIGGCLINQWHKCPAVDKTETLLRDSAPVDVYKTFIRRTDKVAESTWAQQPLLQSSPRSAACVDYRRWVDELILREGL